MTNKEEQHAYFDGVYESLNLAQKAAVDAIEGPVMVIAGPGTGKTQILSARIGKILLETDANPENILCLTYTDAGAVAMRKRLLRFIGPDAYKVNIHTFHSFCNDVIQDNLSLFEKTKLDPISELESIEIFKQLIDGFPKNHPLKRYRGDVYFEINNLKNLFSNMKKEGWTAEYINNSIDSYLKEIPTRDEFIYQRAYKQFKKGDLKQTQIDLVTERMEKLKAAVNEFNRFKELMKKRNRYDFDDMIIWVLDAFKENKLLLAKYQEQFQYILVDEYQDTSGTQNHLVEMLISYWDHPNIFVVGDDDQSIYRFQGANIENMEKFADTYSKEIQTVILTENYRSTQPILNVAKSLIDRNNERLVKKIPGLSKELIASNKKINGLTNPPILSAYESEQQEMIGITIAVEKLLLQGIEPGKIGVIYKENKYGEALSNYFKLKQIPVYSKRSLNILDLPLAKKITLILKYLAAEHDTPFGGDEMLFEILHFNWFAIPPIEIAKLTAIVADKRFGNDKTNLRKYIVEFANQPAKDLFSVPINGLQKAINSLEKLIGDVPNVTLPTLFENIIRETGVLSYIMQHPEKHWLLQELTGLFNFLKEETSRNPSLNLEELITAIELMEKEGIKLPLVQVSGSDKGVNLLTTHGSKGLEFEYVFLAGCNASYWEKKRKPGGGYSMPDTMFSSQPIFSEEEELRRLFYVALTRAEKVLHISYSNFKIDGKPLEPSMFIAEIQEAYELTLNKEVLSKDIISEFAILQYQETIVPQIEKIEANFIDRVLEKFVMNVTALNNYLKCPLQFYFNNLVRVPSGKSESTEFGSAVHHALQKFFQLMQDNNQFPSKQQLIEDFEWYMKRHRENFTKEQFNRRMEYGGEVLSNYFDTYINEWNKVVVIERTIKNVIVNGVPLKGKLDKLEFNGKMVNVVDYKTGDVEKAKEKLLGPNEKQPDGGDYWRQAVFYKILVDNYDQKAWQVISSEFDFIEPDNKKNYRKEKITISDSDISTVKNQITTVWEKIQKHDFYTGCGKEECHWCKFVKHNDLNISIAEIIPEDEENNTEEL
ncbi:MAG: DNA helicase UvrD [Sphingobacteriia bacterium 24-36-13]|jgi:DNA helicase-2/ATP-dependent DNA helicase PcrA|uniref:ATP-dependent helicase n=1 Tax=Sediminibacterium sp. TaxID=1917865 RepID=UPI000BD0B81A|nr:ATP-dependent DNA helicase [Sediminibacterium sp.]OYZ52289.1 MAG: DNA helicase UvrD [Sphingobacteriia bacterium 24-36-13]OZA63709.1 MAG: DNA helicase UvrD [Sphingobacteriia bacterium 39-36-14]MBT9483995.1 ATP-dependent helicase [Sediminibacterium sp.]HQS24613.1 ATP-dependent DNA helicase [Sediminibacterium sp.]HQS34697.1 ATP-dependent DNA helicase [Sediminibacterium sp.]